MACAEGSSTSENLLAAEHGEALCPQVVALSADPFRIAIQVRPKGAWWV